MSKYFISISKTIKAPAEALFNIVANPHEHHRIDGSGTVHGRKVNGPKRLTLGSTFSVDMKLGVPYRMRSKIVEFDENKKIAWRTLTGTTWRYIFDSTDEGTTVTEQWDTRKSPLRAVFALTGFPKSNRKGIKATLKRLAEITE